MFYTNAYLDRDFVESIRKQIESAEVTSYPPTNIYSTKESTFIEIALAGFKDSELSVVTENNNLIVKGTKEKTETGDIVWRQKQISTKNFTRRFPLAEFAVIRQAVFEDGLLLIELQVEIPEEKKPKQITINKTKLLESK